MSDVMDVLCRTETEVEVLSLYEGNRSVVRRVVEGTTTPFQFTAQSLLLMCDVSTSIRMIQLSRSEHDRRHGHAANCQPVDAAS